MTKKLAFALAVGLSMMACKAQVRVEAKAATPPPEPPKVEEPAPAPEPQQGEQIALPDQIEFETDEARIKQTPKTLETLQKLAEVLKKNPRITKLRIEGHTADVGTKKHNDKLSKARAEAVAKWLAQHDVEEKRLTTVGHGSRKPIVANDSADHRAQNRRTEYYVDEVDGAKIAGDQKTVETKPVAANGTTTSGKMDR
jgi:outer membrane protein OmpA-like peptidoglycan-associated protein